MGRPHPLRHLDDDQAEVILQELKIRQNIRNQLKRYSLRAIADRHGINHGCVDGIANGRSYRNIAERVGYWPKGKR